MPTHRLSRFLNLLAGLRRCTVPDLIPIVREQRHPLLLRVAALRWLIHLMIYFPEFVNHREAGLLEVFEERVS